jgi:uncharacterized protein
MRLATVALLTVSNVFMTFAWYGHLKYKNSALWAAVLVSWLIALVEYCFQVPANRLGHNLGIETAQLKTIQEVITLMVFCVFSVLYMKEPLRWNYLLGFVFIACGALFVFAPWERSTATPTTVSISQPSSKSVEAEHRSPPLPPGEGWGEGESR